MSGEVRTCPGCGAAAGADGALTCACEAEGFGPLRVRPYVTLPEPSQPPPPRVPDPYAHPPLPPEQPPAAHDDDHEVRPAERSRRTPVLLLAAIAGVLSVAALVTVLISSGDGDTRAVAQEADPLPATTPAPDRPAPTPSASKRRTTPPAAPPVSHSASARATTPTPTPAPSRTPSPTDSAPSPSAPSSTRPAPPPRETVLRRGDEGPEVTELQYRLGRLGLYADRPDGHFDGRTEYAVAAYQVARGVQGDTRGTYGAATRRALESETRRH